MRLPKRPPNGEARNALVASLMALLIGLGAGSALADGPTATYSGGGCPVGYVISAAIADDECASATVGADGRWSLQVTPDSPCRPNEGSTVSFWINGAVAHEKATFGAGDYNFTRLTLVPGRVWPCLVPRAGEARPTATMTPTDSSGTGAAEWIESSGALVVAVIAIIGVVATGGALARAATRSRSV